MSPLRTLLIAGLAASLVAACERDPASPLAKAPDASTPSATSKTTATVNVPPACAPVAPVCTQVAEAAPSTDKVSGHVATASRAKARTRVRATTTRRAATTHYARAATSGESYSRYEQASIAPGFQPGRARAAYSVSYEETTRESVRNSSGSYASGSMSSGSSRSTSSSSSSSCGCCCGGQRTAPRAAYYEERGYAEERRLSWPGKAEQVEDDRDYGRIHSQTSGRSYESGYNRGYVGDARSYN